MVLVTRNDQMVKQEQYKDLIREAERYRLVHKGLAGHERGNRFYSGALTWLGHRLVAWGRRLQERYGTAAPASMPQSANHLVS
jgi:hypothetical protein